MRRFGWTYLALTLLAPLGGVSCRQHASAPAKKQEPVRRTRAPSASPAGSTLKSPLDAKDTAGAKQRFVELLERRLNRRIKDPRREGKWDFWSEGSSRYVLPSGERAYLMSFRRTSASSQAGFLVIGTITGLNTVVHGHWEVQAGIDDIHIIDMGKAGNMIYTVSFDTTGSKRLIYHHLLRYDGSRLDAVWSYKLGYDVGRPKTYRPVSVTFRDEDRDGTREVRLRIPYKEFMPRLWKRRWAMFKWNPPANEFLPLRGLAFHQVALQKPLWVAAGFLEAVQQRARTHLRKFATDRRHCRTAEELWDSLVRRKYKPVSMPRRKRPVNPYRDKRAWILVDLERKGDPHRYLADIELLRQRDALNSWGICKIRFFRL